MKLLWKNNKPMPATLEAMRQQAGEPTGENLTERVRLVADAVRAQFRTEIYDDCIFWTEEVYDDHVIVRSIIDGKFYSIPYTVSDGTVSFGAATPVELEYVAVTPAEQSNPLAEQLQQIFNEALTQQRAGDPAFVEADRETLCNVRVHQSLDPSGLRFRCQVIAYGMSLTRDIWPREIFEQSLALWEGIPCYMDHPTQSEMDDIPERRVEKKMGWWSAFAVTDQGVEATLTLLPSFESFGRDMQFCIQSGNPTFLPFSIVARTLARQVNGPDGSPAMMHTKIVRPLSVDAVTQAAADGRVKTALASLRVGTSSQGESSMNKQWLLRLFRDNQKRFELVRQSLVAANAQGITAESTVEQMVDIVIANQALVTQCNMAIEMADAMIAQAAPAGDNRATDTRQTAGNPPAPEPRRRQLEDMLITQAWRDSNVPEAIAAARRTALGATATLEEHQAQIEVAQSICGIISENGAVRDNFIGQAARVGAGEFEKRSIGLAKAFGLTRDEMISPKLQSYYEGFCRQSGTPVDREYGGLDLWNSIDATRSIRQFYGEVTGDVNLHGGQMYGRQRLTRQADWLTTDFTEMLGNVMHKRLLRDYREIPQTWRRVVTIKPINDFKTQYAILLGYFSDLDTVTQDNPYTDKAALADTQESYAVAKRGNVVAMTLETIANDDLAGFVRIVSRLGRAAARTLLKFVWNTCIFANPTLAADTVALFHATHNNLITDALGTNGLKAAITKLLSQTEPGSNEPLVLGTDGLTLAVPPGLALDAMSLTDFNYQGGGETNALAVEIRKMGITPVNVPVLSDSNDWGLFANPADLDMVEVGFFNGMEEPEFFTQSDPTQGDNFLKDVVTKHKVRHIYGGAPVDYRGMVKSAVVGA